MDTLSTTLDAVCLASQMILESGGETYRAEETVERMCQGLGIPKVDVLALPTGLMLTMTLEDDSTLSRIVRKISSKGYDYLCLGIYFLAQFLIAASAAL